MTQDTGSLVVRQGGPQFGRGILRLGIAGQYFQIGIDDRVGDRSPPNSSPGSPSRGPLGALDVSLCWREDLILLLNPAMRATHQMTLRRIREAVSAWA